MKIRFKITSACSPAFMRDLAARIRSPMSASASSAAGFARGGNDLIILAREYRPVRTTTISTIRRSAQ